METIDRDVINVQIGDDHSFGCLTVALGRTGEHVITQLNITVPEKLRNYWAYLDFKKPSGATVKTARLDVNDRLIEYEIPQGLLDESGNLETQLVLQSENGEIWKSAIKKFVVLKSIDAENDIPYQEDFITEAQNTLDEIEKSNEDFKADIKETTEEFIEKTQKVLDETKETLQSFPKYPEVDPVFSNNSWELIKWVAQNDDPSKYWKVGNYKLLEINGSTYPMMILGFNHDKVTDPYNYGKQKAGMTLQLGASHSLYGDDKPSLYSGSIPGLMNSEGYFKSPNGVLKDYKHGATNWADSGFRVALQTLFDGTEIADYIVPVQKYTSKYYHSNIYWSDALLTNDKVFLPSEYEVFGQQILAPYIEGEQYEFYKEGHSKFMWEHSMSKLPLNTVFRLWLRSAYATKVNEFKADSSYSCNVYLTIKSFKPLNVLYSPSYCDSQYDSSSKGIIAPCVSM